MWKGKAHFDQSVRQPEICSIVFSSSHIAKIANLNGQLSIVILRLFINSKPNSWQLFQLKVHPQIQFNIAHMSFIFIKLRGPMPSASWIEMSTQTSATPVWVCMYHLINHKLYKCKNISETSKQIKPAHIPCFMYCQPVSTWRQPIHHPLYHTTLSVHLNKQLWQVHGVYLGQPDHPLGPLCVVVAIPTNHGHCCPKASSPNQHY